MKSGGFLQGETVHFGQSKTKIRLNFTRPVNQRHKNSRFTRPISRTDSLTQVQPP
jgi:hypothetical protein